ncbi:serine/threonine-protein kinase PknG [Crossiella equi]|uniref:non-specific serine/threonine protein kinase n=1 Tax=Crossiella equi TaxID=130796 RepID=A0ABS5AJJ2_9PSEU|nr:serine/threonine-protein kinase [Crossiella equi]MBP2476547.1 serine/threonine-protein kinase PknG [Crossiella equi]
MSEGVRWTSGDFLHLPVLRPPEPEDTLAEPSPVPEPDRRCGACFRAVGRGHDGRPGRLKGYCGHCGAAFDYTLKLKPGDLVENRYQVLGCLPRGGQGWVYLARDTHLKLDVVLKGLINSGSGALAGRAIAGIERDMLTALDHPNIVRVISLVLHEGHEYIVMQYVAGWSLEQLKAAAEPLPLEHVLVFLLEVLAAFRYLHERGLLYCDLKPSNVIRGRDRIKLIDFGGVRKVGDRSTPTVVSQKYQVPEHERRTVGLTVSSDLYSVGKVLADLFAATPLGRAPVDESDHTVRAVRALVARATCPDHAHRFASAAELSDALTGLLLDVLSLRENAERPWTTMQFRPSALLLDDGLGTVPALAEWTDRERDPLAPLDSGLPTPAGAAVRLPTPLPDPADPEYGFLAAVQDTGPHRVLAKLGTAPSASLGVRLAECRAQLELGWTDLAHDTLQRLADPPRAYWRLDWHWALVRLALGQVGRAEARFAQLATRLRGEYAPRLALGYCAEYRGDVAEARAWYASVWRRDRSRVSAAFGLARLHLRAGDRGAAVAVLDEVPQVSRYYDPARIAAVRVRLATLGRDRPSAQDILDAAHRLPLLYLDDGAPQGSARTRLTAVVQAVALRNKDFAALDGTEALGEQPTEDSVRRGLERTGRALAGYAPTPADAARLVDLANAVRPRTWW